MGMIKVIIVDDEQSARESLVNCIQHYCDGISIVGLGKNVADAVDLIYRFSPDIVFLDIEMPMGNGFTLFEKIKNPTFETIFTTAYEEFAIKAFRVSALDYLTKPIDFRQLQEAILKFKQKQKVELREQRIELLIENMTNRPNEFNKIVIPDVDGFSLINISEILYCQADGSYTHIHFLKGKKITTSKLLKSIEDLLPSETFFRIHKSHLVNLNLIRRYSKIDGNQLILENETVLDISDRQKKPFFDKINQIKKT
jgi:two-component system LytT family response regulator